MSSIWDPDAGVSYSFDPAEYSSILNDPNVEDATMELLRRKREEATAAAEPKPDYMPPIIRGMRKGVDWGMEQLGKVDVPIPGARTAGEAIGEGYNAPFGTPGSVLTHGVRAAGRLKGLAEEALPAAAEAFKPTEPRTLEEYEDYEPESLIKRAGRGILAGGIQATAPETIEKVEEELPRHTGDVAEMPTVVDAAAIAMIPFTAGGSTASRVALWGNRLGRTVDAIDAVMGAKDIAQGDLVSGAIRMAGGGAGYKFGKMDFIPDEATKFADDVDIPAVDDVTRQMDLEAKGAREGLTDGEYQALEATEARMPDETVRPVGINASAESAASAEAMSRQAGMSSRGERFVVYDQAGNARPLIGPEAVDYQVRPGETYGVEGPQGFRTLDDAGGKPPVEGPTDVTPVRAADEVEPDVYEIDADAVMLEKIEAAGGDPEVAMAFKAAQEEQAARMGKVDPLEEVDQVADDVARVEGDADAAILEADAARAAEEAEMYEIRKADLAMQAGEVEKAKAAAASEKLSWKDWISKNQKNPRDAKVKAEYEAYAKGEVTDYPPGKRPVKGEKKPGIPYKDISAFDKFARRSLSNIKRAAPRAGRRLTSFVDTWDSKKAKWIEDFRTTKDIIRRAGMNEDGIIRYLDGEEIHLPEPELKAAMNIRRLLREIAHEADAVDVLIGERAAYFPHMMPAAGKTKAGKVKGTKFPPGRGKQEPHIEMGRTSEREDWVRNLDVLDNYADNTARRISESTHLGKKHEKLAAEFAKYEDISPTQTNWLKRATQQITHGPGARTAGGLESGTRLTAALLDLPLAAVYQPGQITATMVAGGVRNSLKTAAKMFVDPKFRKLMKTEAARSGATLPDVVQELAGRVGNKQFMKGYLHGIPTTDRAMRVHAFATGEMLLNQADQGHAGARRLLDGMGFKDVDTKVLTPEVVGRKLSDYTQFRTGPAEKPLWASETGLGRFAWQYQHFAYQWGIFVGDVVRNQGITGMLKLAIAGGLAGEVVGDVRSIVKGYGLEDEELGERYALDDPEGYLKAMVTRTKRFPLDHPLHRALQNFFMVGGAGIWFERGAGMALYPGEIGDFGAAFPATRRPIEAAGAITEAVRAGDVEPLRKEFIHQLPLVGYSGWTKGLTEQKKGTRKRKSRSRSRKRR